MTASADSQKLFDQSGVYHVLADTKDAAGVAIHTIPDAPIFCLSKTRIFGEGPETSTLDFSLSGHGIVMGWRRGLVSDAHYITGGWRTCGDAVPVDMSGEWSLGLIGGNSALLGWNAVTRLRVAMTVTKHDGNVWGLTVLAGMNDYELGWGPQPAPWVLYTDTTRVRLAYRLKDGSLHFADQTIAPSDSQITLAFDLDLIALHGPGACLISNYRLPFGLGCAPPVPGALGFWGSFSGRDMSFQGVEFWFNNFQRKLIGGRPPTYDGGPSLPLVNTWGGFNRSLLVYHNDQHDQGDLVRDITVENVTLHGFSGHAVVNVGSMQGGFGLRIKNTRIEYGTRAVQSLAHAVAYPMHISESLLVSQNDCNLYLSRASGVKIDDTQLDYGRRCVAHLVGCVAEIDGPLMMAPPGVAQQCVIYLDGGRLRASNLLTDVEYGPGIPRPEAFLLFRPATYDQATFKTEAVLQGCAGVEPLVKVLPRQLGYAWGQSYLTVSGGPDEERKVRIGSEDTVIPSGATMRL